MAGLGVPELLIILVVALLLFGGYKKLPDASRSLGRSLRIFKGEMKGMKDDDSGRGAQHQGGRSDDPGAPRARGPCSTGGLADDCDGRPERAAARGGPDRRGPRRRAARPRRAGPHGRRLPLTDPVPARRR